jgi:hypothetical protein
MDKCAGIYLKMQFRRASRARSKMRAIERRSILLNSLISFLALAAVLSAAHSSKPPLGVLEIAPLDIPASIDLPADFKAAVQQHLVDQLERTHRFSSVLTADNARVGEQPTIRLTVTLSTFRAGSRGERYLLGPMAGNTVIKAHARFIDIGTGIVKAEKDVGGRVAIGLFGGDSKGATNGLAKGVAGLAKKQL